MKVFASVHRAHFSGGAELSTFYTMRELARRGHQIDLVYGEGGDLVAEYESFCASVRHLHYWDYPFPQSRLRALIDGARLVPAVALAAKSKPDVYYMGRVFGAVWALQAARISPAPVVCHWRGTATPPARYIPSLSDKMARFISNSEFTRRAWLAVGIDPDKIETVYAGIDPADYPPGGAAEREAARVSLDLPPSAFVAVFVGRFDTEKGIEVLLDAWRRLRVTASEAVLLLVGEPVIHKDPQAYLEHLASLAPAGSVRFLGARRDVVTPLHAADVAVVPSTWDEPYGRVVVEALATGRPVVASRVGGIPEIMAGPFERFLFERGDAAGLATRLSETMDWRESEPELGEQCTARVRENFSLTSMVDGIESVLQRAVEARARA